MSLFYLYIYCVKCHWSARYVGDEFYFFSHFLTYTQATAIQHCGIHICVGCYKGRVPNNMDCSVTWIPLGNLLINPEWTCTRPCHFVSFVSANWEINEVLPTCILHIFSYFLNAPNSLKAKCSQADSHFQGIDEFVACLALNQKVTQ